MISFLSLAFAAADGFAIDADQFPLLAGAFQHRLDKTAIIHVPVGKKSFGAEKLIENMNVVVEAIQKAKPAAAKGTYIKSVSIASTMGPGVKVNIK